MSTQFDLYLEQALERSKRACDERRQKAEAILGDSPETLACDRHAGSVRPIDRDETYRTGAAVYGECPDCVTAKALAGQNRMLHGAGVPSNLLHATFETWKPNNPAEESTLTAVMEFAQAKRGFLVMAGNVGTGKTHLAVAVMRSFKRPRLVKQNTLLREMRARYTDRNLPDPIPAYQHADLLVLDELGVSGGGKDEYPMMNEILAHRFDEYKPTIITTNCGPEEMEKILGERLIDRIRQASFRAIKFGGKSHRAEHRSQYLHGRENE